MGSAGLPFGSAGTRGRFLGPRGAPDLAADFVPAAERAGPERAAPDRGETDFDADFDAAFEAADRDTPAFFAPDRGPPDLAPGFAPDFAPDSGLPAPGRLDPGRPSPPPRGGLPPGRLTLRPLSLA